jgi:hypothetical protein
MHDVVASGDALHEHATTARLAARADGRLALVPDDRSVQRDFTGFARHKAWCGEVPGWASLGPVGVVDTYWRWRELELPELKPPNAAAWGFRVGHGGSRSYGLLGATFEPHNYPFLRVAVAATTGEGAGCPAPFDEATVGLPHEYVGGVLAGAVREAATVGRGSVTFAGAAVHPVDSSWEVFRLLAVGVMRLLALRADEMIRSDMLLYFGGTSPEQPGLA